MERLHGYNLLATGIEITEESIEAAIDTKY